MLHLMTPSPETPSPGDDARWNAVQRRDHAADGTFVYSVRTTGVYCRPSCAARLPRRENVAFHQTSVVRGAPAPARECRLPPDLCRRRTGGISAVQTLPPE